MTRKTVDTPLRRLVRRRPLHLARALGPGLIAGASDNDPTTVATLAVIGSTTGYRLAWLVVLVIPMLVVVQVISARVGVVCRAGLADAIRVRYGRPWAILTLLLVLTVNLVTLVADLEGGGAALLFTATGSWPGDQALPTSSYRVRTLDMDTEDDGRR